MTAVRILLEHPLPVAVGACGLVLVLWHRYVSPLSVRAALEVLVDRDLEPSGRDRDAA